MTEGKKVDSSLYSDDRSTSEDNDDSSNTKLSLSSHPSEWHAKLKDCEAQRRSEYNAKLESMTLYFKSYRDLISCGVRETKRAQRLCRGISKAHKQVAQVLDLDDEDPGFAEPLLNDEESSSSLLACLEESNATIVEQFDESATSIETMVAKNIGKLLDSIQQQEAQVEQLGQDILEVLQATENQVLQAWDAYFGIAASSLQNMNSPGCVGAAEESHTDALPAPSSSDSKSLCVKDTWLAEFCYRSSVSRQSHIWEQGCAELDGLFSTVRSSEIARRTQLRGLLLSFGRLQQNAFAVVENAQAIALANMAEAETSHEEIQENVQVHIRQILEDEVGSSIFGGGGAFLEDDSESTTGFYENLFASGAPLESDYLLSAMVVDWKWSNATGDATLALAIVTSTLILHLFDLPSAQFKVGEEPEIAFQALLPSPDGTSSDLSSWSGRTLTPACSVALSRCSIAMSQQELKVEVLDRTVTEVGSLQIRVSSPREQIALIAAMHGEPTRTSL